MTPFSVFPRMFLKSCRVFKILCYPVTQRPSSQTCLQVPDDPLLSPLYRTANTLPLTPCQKAPKRPLGQSTLEKRKQLCKVKSRVGIRSNKHWPYRKMKLQLIKPYQSKSTSLISFWAWDGNGLIWLTTPKGNKALKKKKRMFIVICPEHEEKNQILPELGLNYSELSRGTSAVTCHH